MSRMTMILLPLLALLLAPAVAAASTSAETITASVPPGETWSYTLPPGYYSITICYTASRTTQYPTTRGVITIAGQAWRWSTTYYAWAPWECVKHRAYSDGNITVTVRVDSEAKAGTDIKLEYARLEYCCGAEFSIVVPSGERRTVYAAPEGRWLVRVWAAADPGSGGVPILWVRGMNFSWVKGALATNRTSLNPYGGITVVADDVRVDVAVPHWMRPQHVAGWVVLERAPPPPPAKAHVDVELSPGAPEDGGHRAGLLLGAGLALALGLGLLSLAKR